VLSIPPPASSSGQIVCWQLWPADLFSRKGMRVEGEVRML